ncbi:MAG: hypothetical protein M0Z62_00590, partial [Actinomycetota bacterium]|nr:hypothetical protein [Actinomycetota bacterium]
MASKTDHQGDSSSGDRNRSSAVWDGLGTAVTDLLAIPGATVSALEAVAAMPERVDRLLTVAERLAGILERTEGTVRQAATGVDLAGRSIRDALGGVELVVDVMERSVPGL